MSAGGDEFDLIARHFAPLARTEAARGLRDDAALLPASGPMVITADTIVEGVHFLPDDPPDAIAQKALRVNVSDIAAKGAKPTGYLLSLCWPDTRDPAGIGAFAEGLARDQAIFGCTLLGGDTTRTPGPLTVSITMVGRPAGLRTPARAGARPGDLVWVTGSIGDGWLGLRARRGVLPGASADDLDVLAERYLRPQPRVELAAAVAAFATASLDVSDGLLGDALKIANASGVGLSITPVRVPVSDAAARWLERQAEQGAALADLCNGGDDYEILLTAPPSATVPLQEAAADAGVRLTPIGAVSPGKGVEAGGMRIGGHVHRLGASTNRQG